MAPTVPCCAPRLQKEAAVRSEGDRTRRWAKAPLAGWRTNRRPTTEGERAARRRRLPGGRGAAAAGPHAAQQPRYA